MSEQQQKPDAYHVVVHEEAGSWWAEVRELPGCFASGHTLDELKEAIVEAVRLYVTPEDESEGGEPAPALRLEEMVLATG